MLVACSTMIRHQKTESRQYDTRPCKQEHQYGSEGVTNMKAFDEARSEDFVVMRALRDAPPSAVEG